MPAPQDCQKEGRWGDIVIPAGREQGIKRTELIIACAIQDCLTRANYNEQKCASYVDALYKCCSGMYAAAKEGGGEIPKSTACPIESVVNRRMKAMAKNQEGK